MDDMFNHQQLGHADFDDGSDIDISKGGGNDSGYDSDSKYVDLFDFPGE